MLLRLLRANHGNMAVLSAVMMTSLVGVGGLVTDYGTGLMSRMVDQRTADIAAIAGATVYGETGSASSMSTAVSNILSRNGYASTAAAASLVTSPSGDGNEAVKVIVSSTVPLTLSRMLSDQSSLRVNATSYAEVKASAGGCILALSPNSSKAITISGSANVQAPNCTVVSDSDNSDALDMSGSAKLTTPCSVSVGGQNTTSGLTLTKCTNPTTNAPATPDPYASVPEPTSLASGTCLTLPNPPINVPQGYYCHGINVSTTATFQAGTYYVKGNLAFQGGSNVSGSNVTFFVDKSGTTAISGSATVNISAPTSGTYSGILLFGDRAGGTSNNNNISGSSSSVLTGALYYPTEEVTYSGGSSSPSACTQVVGYVITFSGSAYVGDSCSGVGVANINVSGLPSGVALVQ